jgi:hypothetical protein
MVMRGLVFISVLGLIVGPVLADYPEKPITVINPNTACGGTDCRHPHVAALCRGPPGQQRGPDTDGHAGCRVSRRHHRARQCRAGRLHYRRDELARPNLPNIDAFEHIGNVVGVSSTLSVRMDSESTSLQEAVEYIRSTDETIDVGMGGIGADGHLVGLQLEKLLDTSFNFIPFGSGADARNALPGGQGIFSMMSNVEAAGFSDEVRPPAIAAVERSALFPDVPTFIEEGYDLVGGSTHVIAAPEGFPRGARQMARMHPGRGRGPRRPRRRQDPLPLAQRHDRRGDRELRARAAQAARRSLERGPLDQAVSGR